MNKLNKLLVPLYVLFLIGSFFYVKSVIKGVPVSVEDTSDDKTVEIKSVKVSLTVKAPSYTKTYTQESKNIDTVSDLLLQIKENNTDFTFDRTSYSYGSEFDHINGIKATETMEWRIFDGEKDVTLKINDTELEDGKNYVLVFQKVTE
ncbi:hypothetical protein A3K01_04170 [candidate division WWE3 bacterium RIFOXYD1_FULL_43_17]|uniref:DUF4430 domain-containing protein n=2 Tax=Katanobacteria TaxID=422282 RepID=A0A1F4XDZ2_UNCKA|nr:MAG: hypothetical protein UU59_C0015G0006 [candidate division WWE3 bacterium GW2011_GWE1_41_27]OGC79887.1 MAG: hypothetical protein A3K01_04170 [candidate division WWE3 bacterium RIFOXYD1_FULL_43_17]